MTRKDTTQSLHLWHVSHETKWELTYSIKSTINGYYSTRILQAFTSKQIQPQGIGWDHTNHITCIKT